MAYIKYTNRKHTRYVVQICDIETNELLMEEDVNVPSMEEAEQYAENLIEDNFDYSKVYFLVN